jgi:hypothetical protein
MVTAATERGGDAAAVAGAGRGDAEGVVISESEPVPLACVMVGRDAGSGATGLGLRFYIKGLKFQGSRLRGQGLEYVAMVLSDRFSVQVLGCRA